VVNHLKDFSKDALYYKNKAEFEATYDCFLSEIDINDERYSVVKNVDQPPDLFCNLHAYSNALFPLSRFPNLNHIKDN